MRWEVFVSADDDGRPPHWWSAVLALLIVLNVVAGLVWWAVAT